MATAREESCAEYVTESYHRYSTCDTTAYYFNSEPYILQGGNIDATYWTTPQLHPNAQFYCTKPEIDKSPLEYGDSYSDIETPEVEDIEDLLSKQAAEVAAARRFISQANIEAFDNLPYAPSQSPQKPRLGSLTTVRDSILDNSLFVPKSRSTNMQVNSPPKRKVSRPPPLQLTEMYGIDETIQTPLPTRTSSKGAPSFDLARPLDSARSFSSAKQSSLNLRSPSLQSEPKTPLTILTPEAANDFHFDFSIPAEPRLSRSGSGATVESDPPATPILGPNEDQIRRDIEAFVLEQGPFVRGTRSRARRLQNVHDDDSKQANEEQPPPVPTKEDTPLPLNEVTTLEPQEPRQDGVATASPTLRRKRSIFGWLQKKPEVEVDDLIDLYMTDEQREEVKTVRSKPSRSKLTVFRNRVVTDPLPIKAG